MSHYWCLLLVSTQIISRWYTRVSVKSRVPDNSLFGQLCNYFRVSDYLRYCKPAAIPPCTLYDGPIQKALPNVSQSPSLTKVTFTFLHTYPQPLTNIFMMRTGHLHLAMALDHCWPKWADIILVPLLLGAEITGSVAPGTSVLVLQGQGFRTLSKQVKQDLGFLESSFSIMDHQVDSLAEALQKASICSLWSKEDLRETCCFMPARQE